MLRYRLIMGTLLIALLLGLFWLDAAVAQVELAGWWRGLFAGRPRPPSGMVLLAGVVVLIPLAARELARMFREVGLPGHTLLISFASICCAVSLYSTPMMLRASTGAAIIATVLVGVFLVALLWHSRDAKVQGVIAAAGATMIAVVLLGIMLGFYLAIRRWHSAWVVLAVILITKSGDIGAYFAGRAFGRHKLIPWLSPKKTWEGLAGAIVLATLVAAGLAYLSQCTELASIMQTRGEQAVAIVRRYDVIQSALAGAFLAIVGHAGDLMVSLFKRDAGVKDAGGVLPGFGGLLDVLDSPLLVAPVAYWLLEWASG